MSFIDQQPISLDLSTFVNEFVLTAIPVEATQQAKLQALFAGAPHLNRLTISEFTWISAALWGNGCDFPADATFFDVGSSSEYGEASFPNYPMFYPSALPLPRLKLADLVYSTPQSPVRPGSSLQADLGFCILG
ncbi:hypothetical protein N5P37_009083 [Trichoderma harzianum]|uniref:Uncharacterized protein n=1 Tax=Trichoderma harzianum CBS 226.95 TaxID=983964 RepID=A0A2T4A6B7_TRIHA|nr:hypothetical protein M431DRAFT_483682 [Trichoderma harzianum CBS 226.95]KAK0758684.1 hypothetical protein N5P37_009083 [Trichoderma harzianum]PKK52935.1 hypothetical protein CI102_2215 [Trichoderma harzianum]PTB52533.1 hypothetical protein M431DRAFT_483682 [Trichoderma harzianum CBS 226.95]